MTAAHNRFRLLEIPTGDLPLREIPRPRKAAERTRRKSSAANEAPRESLRHAGA